MAGASVSAIPTTGAVAASSSAPPKFEVEADPKWQVGVELRPMDRDIFARLMSESLKREELPDLFPDRPYRVRVVGSVYEHRYGLVTIDFERDGKEDERWEIREAEVQRTALRDPATPKRPPTLYTLRKGRWQPH
jgi:hypothetical protein